MTHATRARSPARALWIDGELRSGPDAAISLFDRGARDGEGLFETFRVRSGRIPLWQWHLERLVLAAAELGFPVPPSPSMLESGVAAVVEAQRLTDAVARITVTRGIAGGRPTRTGCWIDAEAFTARAWRRLEAEGARAIVSRRPFLPGALAAYKTTSRLAYHLARDEARAARADEALLVSPAGELLEGSVSNVFLVLGDEVVTPPAERILPGVTRRFVLELCGRLGIPARTEPLRETDLHRADEVILTNAVQGVAPVAFVAERRIPSRRTGDRLRDAYEEAIARL